MRLSVFILFLFFSFLLKAQQDGSVILKDSVKPENILSLKSFAVPGTLILYGFASLEVEALDGLNESINGKIISTYPAFKTRADDYLQHTPIITTYLLDAAGIKGKHNMVDKTIIYGTGLIITSASVLSLKKITNELRPDGSKSNSFPSGHTANAFLGAEILRLEYGARYPLIAITGYTVAAATGVLRMMNNRHWFSDVVAGAGFGILSARLSYWIFEKIGKKKNKK